MTKYICRLKPNKDGLIGCGVKFNRIRRVTRLPNWRLIPV